LITKKQPAKKTEPAPFALSLRANFSWTFVGNVAYAACQWGMVIALAKLGSPEMVGQFALGLAIAAPIMMLANLQLRSVQATDARQEFAFGHYFGLRLLTALLALLAITSIALFLGYSWETAIVICVIGLAKVFESISDVFYGLLQQHERMDWIAQSMLIRGPVSLIALGLGVYITGSLIWGVFGMAIAWVLVMLGYDFRKGNQITRLTSSVSDYFTRVEKVHPLWDWRVLGLLTKVALPLGVVMMLISFNTNIPRYFIEYYWGERELGIFAAIAYLMVVGRTVVGSLGQSVSPRLAKYYAASNISAFKKLLSKLVALGMFVGGIAVLVATLIGKELLTFIYQPEYARQDVFILLMIAAGISYVGSFFGYSMTAVRYFRIQLPLYAVVTVTTVLVGLWLIPNYGLSGAAWSLIGSAIVQAVLSYLVVRHALIHGLNQYVIIETKTN
jgi:O-antigen/teichoic acid export membrane protein